MEPSLLAQIPLVALLKTVWGSDLSFLFGISSVTEPNSRMASSWCDHMFQLVGIVGLSVRLGFRQVKHVSTEEI